MLCFAPFAPDAMCPSDSPKVLFSVSHFSEGEITLSLVYNAFRNWNPPGQKTEFKVTLTQTVFFKT